MVKQTNAEHTLGRSKGKYKGDEDSLKSSTDKPRKELEDIMIELEQILYLMRFLDREMYPANLTFSTYQKFYIRIYGYISQLADYINDNLLH